MLQDYELSFQESGSSLVSSFFSASVVPDENVTLIEGVNSHIVWVQNHNTSILLASPQTGNSPFRYETYPPLPFGLNINEEGILFGAPTSRQSETEYTFYVYDSNDDVAEYDFYLSVVEDTEPEFPEDAITSYHIVIQSDLTINLPQGSGGNSPYTYSISPELPTSVILNKYTGEISFSTSYISSTENYNYLVTDRDGDTDNLNLSIEFQPARIVSFDSFQLIDSYRTVEWGVGQSISIQFAVSGNNPFRFTIEPALPLGVTLSSTGLISGIPLIGQETVDYTVTVADLDGDTDIFNFSARVDNGPRFLQEIQNRTLRWIVGEDNTYFNVLVERTGVYPFRIDNRAMIDNALPDGIQLYQIYNEFNLQGRPLDTFSKTRFELTAIDGVGNTAQLSFFIEVQENIELAFADGEYITDQAWRAGQRVNLVLPEPRKGNAPYSYTVNGLPDWLSFDANTRTISGLVGDEGTAEITYEVTDFDGDSDELYFSYRVMPEYFGINRFGPIDWQETSSNRVILPGIRNPITEPTFRFGGTVPEWLNLDVLSQNYRQVQVYSPVISGTSPIGQADFTLRIIATIQPIDPSLGTYYTDRDQLSVSITIRDLDNPVFLQDANLSIDRLTTKDTCRESDSISSWDPLILPDSTTYLFVQNANVEHALPRVTSRDGPITFSFGSNTLDWLNLNTITYLEGDRKVYQAIVNGIPTNTQNKTSYQLIAMDSDGDVTNYDFSVVVEADSSPSFAISGTCTIQMIENLHTTTKLPIAIGGNGQLTYSLQLLSSLDSEHILGVSFDKNSSEWIGTPKEHFSYRIYNLIVTDIDGDTARRKIRLHIEEDDHPIWHDRYSSTFDRTCSSQEEDIDDPNHCSQRPIVHIPVTESELRDGFELPFGVISNGKPTITSLNSGIEVLGTRVVGNVHHPKISGSIPADASPTGRDGVWDVHMNLSATDIHGHRSETYFFILRIIEDD